MEYPPAPQRHAASPAVQALETEAPAKLNLYLHVLGRRADGYHDLDSLVAFVDIADTLHVAPAPEFGFEVVGPLAAALKEDDFEDNLCVRAARALAEHLDRPLDLKLTLVKRLPVAAGIGGGSSDAAATLKLLARFWAADVEDATLSKIGIGLGADVPACLKAVAAEVHGIGEDVRPVPGLPPAAVVLVNPGFALPTARVFRAWRATGAECPPWTPPPHTAALATALIKRRNDLTQAAIGLEPMIADVLDALAARPDCLLARMSGSGATCFGLFENPDIAEAAAEVMQATHPTWWVRPARLLAEQPAVRLAGVEPVLG
jgi:4-diphosphocytidyl-2-C-methyl-D-erythritol kinase